MVSTIDFLTFNIKLCNKPTKTPKSMKKHNFVYNYGFLTDWLNANPTIQRNDFLSMMEMSDYNTLRQWTMGNTMMPLTQMMKFCNRFCVPITAFFYDEEADEQSIFTPLSPNAMIEPNGGWPDASRKAGMKVCDPRSIKSMESIIPSYIHTEETNATESTDAMKDEEIQSSERKRYLDMIDRLSGRIVELSRIMEEQQRTIAALSRAKTQYDCPSSLSTQVAEEEM